MSLSFYADAALLWHGEAWRRPNAEEWEDMLGMNPGFTKVKKQPTEPKSWETIRIDLLGNTWDVKSATCWGIGFLEALTGKTLDEASDRLVVVAAPKR